MYNAITIKDLAKMSNVSVSTVSKALNEKNDINESTKRRIQNLAKEHKYVPNNSAISLRMQKTKTIAVIVPDISNPLCGDILSEIQNLSFRKEYKLLVLQSFRSSEKEMQCLQFVNDGSVDGAIIIAVKFNRNYSSSFNSIPNVMVELKKFDIPNQDNKRMVKFYFNKLMIKID